MTEDNGPDADERAGAHATAIDPETGDSVSEGVVTAVAALTDESPVELPPLYDAVDPDALEALVDHAQRLDDPATLQLAFDYEGFRISVRGDGRIRLTGAPDEALA